MEGLSLATDQEDVSFLDEAAQLAKGSIKEAPQLDPVPPATKATTSDVPAKMKYNYTFQKWVKPGLDNDVDIFGLWHSATEKVRIQFGRDTETYEFPKAALVASFGYFKRVFKPGTSMAFLEATQSLVEFNRSLPYEDFSTLLFWLQTGGLRTPVETKPAVITACLRAIIAADYLQMTNMSPFVGAVEVFLTKHLTAHRTALVAQHLHLVENNATLFEKVAIDIYNTFISAGVKPFLVPQATAIPVPGEHSVQCAAVREWQTVVKHYEVLMKNTTYALDVMSKARQTLRVGYRQNQIELKYPIPEDKKRGQGRTTHVNVVTYWDPLFKHPMEGIKKAVFSL